MFSTFHHETPDYRRSDIMSREGTALFTYLAQTAFAETLQVHDTTLLTDVIRTGYTDGQPLTPTDQAWSIIKCHAYFSDEKYPNLVGEATRRHLTGINRESVPQDMRQLLNIFRAATYQKTIVALMQEAHDTTLHLPMNLLAAVQQATTNNGLSPVYTSLQEITDAYRSEWFQDVCTDAAMTANGIWQAYSTERRDLWPTIAADQGFFDVKFDFSEADGRTRFCFNDTTKRVLRNEMRRRNQDARQIRSASAASSRLSDWKEDYKVGTTSGCPVGHDKPRFNTNNPSHATRLDVVARIANTTPAQLMSAEKNGIAYALDAVAGMLERCVPHIIDAQKEYEERYATAT